MSLPSIEQAFVVGSITTATGLVPRISSSLKWTDHWGTIKARWGVGRMKYTVQPGLYALGQPDKNAPVLVTANYKMSFDRLREAIPGHDLWILVLDTKGINVWCAAGKGTFGTGELVARIEFSRLAEMVAHRQLILPQLGAPGVAAHKVKKLSGFKVVYGPVRSGDLPAFIDCGCQSTPEMRRKTFTILERAVLIPVELVTALKTAVLIVPVFYLLGGLGGPRGFWDNASSYGLFAALAFMSAVLAGTVLTPLLLPWIPGRAFSLKGLVLGLLTAAGLAGFRGFDLARQSGVIELLSWFLIVPAVTSYLAMNFTGCSTYTSLSGVKKEMRWSLPIEIIAATAGAGLWLLSRFVS